MTSDIACQSSFPPSTPSQSLSKENSRNSSAADGLKLNPFGFEARTAYNASQDLTHSRSNSFMIKPPVKDNDIWKKPPPDFRPQVYLPKPPKRNSRDAMKPWNYGTTDQKPSSKKGERVFLPHILELDPKESAGENFRTRFHILDPDEARADAVQKLIFPAGEYTMPQPHDFRQLPSIYMMGLPEFTTHMEPDPYNIKFHTQRPRIILGINTISPAERDIKGLQMAPPLIQPPKYEERLILNRDPWPQRNCAYTRYRSRSRTAHSALMDRVDETLTAEWAKNKLDQALNSVHGESEH